MDAEYIYICGSQNQEIFLKHFTFHRLVCFLRPPLWITIAKERIQARSKQWRTSSIPFLFSYEVLTAPPRNTKRRSLTARDVSVKYFKICRNLWVWKIRGRSVWRAQTRLHTRLHAVWRDIKSNKFASETIEELRDEQWKKSVCHRNRSTVTAQYPAIGRARMGKKKSVLWNRLRILI